ncbi:MAG: Crp/Fnr family transcriptional regulator [Chitinophagaceae bacterium]
MEKLLNHLSSIHPLSAGLQQYLLSNLKAKTLKRKDYVLKKGQISSHIYFVKQGLLRCFYLKNNTEVSSWFMREGDVIISVESFFQQKPSYESIQVLEDCELFYITYEELQHIYRTYPEFNFVGRILTETYYTLSEQRLYSLRMQRSQERYQYLLTHQPELILRVPAKYLASYLGITEVTLSKIKAR